MDRNQLTNRGMATARAVARWTGARTPVLTVGGFGFLSAAAWTLHVAAGLAAIGVALLILEYLTSSE